MTQPLPRPVTEGCLDSRKGQATVYTRNTDTGQTLWATKAKEAKGEGVGRRTGSKSWPRDPSQD